MSQSNVTCPECGEPMRRERRLLIQGHTPFLCSNGHTAVDDAEPIISDHGGFTVVAHPKTGLLQEAGPSV